MGVSGDHGPTTRPRVRPTRSNGLTTVATEPATIPVAARTGSRVSTAEGRFLDLCHGWGTAVLGWADPAVEAAAANACPDDPARLTGRLLERLPYADAVVFRSAFSRLLADVLAAAKRVTGRDGAWFCDFAAPLSLQAVRQLIDNAPGGVAAFVVDTLDAPAAVLSDLRALATVTGAVLIFDESRTAPRVHAAGSYGLFGVEPDVALLGAALANGRPLAAAAGRRDLLSAMPEGDSPTAAAFAAAGAALDRIERVDAPAAIRVAGAEIGAELDDALRRAGADAFFTVEGDPSWLRLAPASDGSGSAQAMSAFVEAALFDRGVIAPSAFIPAWTTGGAEIAELVRACAGAFDAAAHSAQAERFERRARVRRVG